MTVFFLFKMNIFLCSTSFIFQFSFASQRLRRTNRKILVTNNYQKLKIVHIFRWGLCLLSSMETIQQKQSLIEWPFITLHGDDDKMCDVVGSQKLFDSAKSRDKEIKVSAGLKINTSKQLKFWFAFILIVVKKHAFRIEYGTNTNCNDVFVIDVMEKPVYICCPYVKSGNNIRTIDPGSWFLK